MFIRKSIPILLSVKCQLVHFTQLGLTCLVLYSVGRIRARKPTSNLVRRFKKPSRSYSFIDPYSRSTIFCSSPLHNVMVMFPPENGLVVDRKQWLIFYVKIDCVLNLLKHTSKNYNKRILFFQLKLFVIL